MPTETPSISHPEPLKYSPELVREHGLTPDEYEKIVASLGRTPSLTELGIFSVMWSEHCSYKSSRVHLKRLPTRGPRVMQGPGENAGIIDIGDGWACAFKIESHNHPSYIEPFQGATTGVGGILRDIFTMGARPLAVMDSLRFGPIENRAGKLDQGLIHKNHAILEGVVSGIASYGNCFGVPNLGGETKFEPCYSGNPLVNAFALGLVRHDEIFYGRAAGAGNPVIYVGSKTGRDGIHGATMASEEFKEGSEQKRPNVQVGDPFLEKLLLEACLEAMQTGAVVGIQDMGAAGLTCSSCEMGARGGVGIEIELDRVPQRETGMNSYEIMLSESQERMLLVAEQGREDEILRIFEKWGLDGVIIGRVVPENRMRVFQGGAPVADIPNTALTDEAPLYHRPLQPWKARVPEGPPANLAEPADLGSALKRLVSAVNICSKRWIFEQYDSMVQTNTVQGPGADGGVMRVKGTRRALAMALDGNSRWCYLNPRLGAMHAVAEAARNVACTGATPVAATNCLNFGNPEKPEIMWQFSEAVDGLAAACSALGTPVTGGNVSFYNETLGEGIYPTPVLGVVGILEDVSRSVPARFPRGERALVLLEPSTARDLEAAQREFGSSEYAKEIVGTLWGTPPALDLQKEAALHKLLAELAQSGMLDSAHDCSEGGLAVAVAKTALASGAGVSLELKSNGLPATIALFAENATRAIVSCDSNNVERIIQSGVHYGLAPRQIGQISSLNSNFEVRIDGAVKVFLPLAELEKAWEGALSSALQVETV